MVVTGNYRDWQSDEYVTYSISADRGSNCGYNGNCYYKLAPKIGFLKVWYENIGRISEEANNKFYINEYWKKVLSKLDPDQVYREVDNSILLCYQACHRHVVAAWFELTLGVDIPEGKLTDDGSIEFVERPKYIKKNLEETIRRYTDMHGFNSLQAFYLYEKSKKIEILAEKLENDTGECYDEYRKLAESIRLKSNMIEAEYNSSKVASGVKLVK